VIADVVGIAEALQPVAATPIVAVPLKAAFQVTFAEVPLPLTLPADDGVSDQAYPVALLTAPVV
jgi:hypothetical protein